MKENIEALHLCAEQLYLATGSKYTMSQEELNNLFALRDEIDELLQNIDTEIKIADYNEREEKKNDL